MAAFKISLLALTAVFILWLAGYGLFVATVLAYKPAQPQKTTQAIVVLTGGDQRVSTGLSLFAMKLAPNLFISGVHDGTTLDELIRGWPGLPPGGKRALPACCMELGHSATTTRENARETQEWLERSRVKSIRLVTSPYHMPRAMIEFRALMPDLAILPHPVTGDPLGPRDEFFWHITFMEYHKFLVRYAWLKISQLAMAGGADGQ